MTRTVKISLKFATPSKANKLKTFLRAYRSAVNFYIKSLWKCKGKLDKATLNRLTNTPLGYNQRTIALRQALSIVVSTRLAAKELRIKATCPVFKGKACLTEQVITVQRGKKSFDYVIKISSLTPIRRITIPFKSHKRLKYWLDKGGKLLNTVNVGETEACLIIDLPDKASKPTGKALGLDVGYSKLISDSKGKHYGTNIKDICLKVRRCKRGSVGFRKAQKHRSDYINQTVNDLPWETTKLFVIENLKNLKRGKGNRGKKNRKLLQPWTYRQVRTRIEQKAQENRVRLEVVNPKNTSRTCPKCGLVEAENRKGGIFSCIRCNYTADADTVGATNILNTFRNYRDNMMPFEASINQS